MQELEPNRTVNPYISARRRWDLHVGDALAGRLVWQCVAILCAVSTLATIAWAAHLDLQPKLLPYVIKVDELGNAEAFRVADRLKGADTRTIQQALTDFVTFARRVTADEAQQVIAVNRAMAKISREDPAYNKYLEIYGERKKPPNPMYPFLRAATETAEAEVYSVLQQTEESWEVEWMETVWDRRGRRTDRFKMRGLFQVYLASEAVTDDEALHANPVGVYVRGFHWGRVRKRGAAR